MWNRMNGGIFLFVLLCTTTAAFYSREYSRISNGSFYDQFVCVWVREREREREWPGGRVIRWSEWWCSSLNLRFSSSSFFSFPHLSLIHLGHAHTLISDRQRELFTEVNPRCVGTFTYTLFFLNRRVREIRITILLLRHTCVRIFSETMTTASRFTIVVGCVLALLLAVFTSMYVVREYSACMYVRVWVCVCPPINRNVFLSYSRAYTYRRIDISRV